MQNKNGIELDVFVLNDGLRYKIKTIAINDASKLLIDSLMDGIGKIIGAIDNNEGDKKDEETIN